MAALALLGGTSIVVGRGLLAEVPSPPDAADALALALCHLAMAPLRARVGVTRK